MGSFKVITDSCSDLGKQLAQQLEIQIAPLGVELDGRFFEDGQMESKEFYEALHKGKISTTSAVNPDRWMAVMEPIVAAGLDVLVIAFAATMSTTCHSAVLAAEELTAKYPDRKILVADSLSASAGQGMMVWRAARMQQSGASLEETYRWVMDNRLRVANWITVDDLKYLKRGGRISSTTALLGTMLSIKPLIRINDRGTLDSVAKARGRKAALNFIMDKLEKTGLPGQNDTLFIAHADCEDDAEYFANAAKQRCGVKETVICPMGSVIGSHLGPGGMLVGFMAENR